MPALYFEVQEERLPLADLAWTSMSLLNLQ